jgi:uncharacterized protein (TIGR00369 family)
VSSPGRSGRFVHEDWPGHILGQMRLWQVDDPEVGPTLEVDALPELCNPHGSPHAAVLAGLIDCAAAGLAVTAADSVNLAGADLTVRFLDKIRVGPARALPRILRISRRSVVVQVDVIDVGNDRALATTATMSFTRLDG